MTNKEIKKLVLETLIECYDDMSCYPSEGDNPFEEFVREAEQKLNKLKEK